jgi:DNA-binding transcriptional MerR regulator
VWRVRSRHRCQLTIPKPLRLWVVAMAADTDDDELLSGLTGQARRERGELIEWLLAHDFPVQQIRDALVPMLLPAHRVVGDDGTYVSAQQLCDATGIDPELLVRLHQAVGLPRVDDRGAAVQSRADAESVLRSKALIDFGFDVEEVVAILRVLVEGLGHAAETMRKAALRVVLRPEELERIANRLAELPRDVVVSPVRFVKTIGDAVMFVSSDSERLLNVVLDLLSAAAQHELPRLRAGIASGWAVSMVSPGRKNTSGRKPPRESVRRSQAEGLACRGGAHRAETVTSAHRRKTGA